jgi:hypothetical protein
VLQNKLPCGVGNPACSRLSGGSFGQRILNLGKRRLKTGGSQNWLPHFSISKCAPIGYPVVVFLLNALVCFRLFRTEYLDHLSSIEGAFIAMARYIRQHGSGYDWFPMWFAGMPFSFLYQPLLHHVVAASALIFHSSVPSAYHFITATTYSLGGLTFYFLVKNLGRDRLAAFCAAIVFSLFSPALLFLPAVRADVDGLGNALRLQAMVGFGEGPNVTGLTLCMLALSLLHLALSRQTAASAFAASVALAAVLCASWPSTVVLSLAFFCYLIALDYQSLHKSVPRMAAIGLAAYALASPFALPSTIWITLTNATGVSDDLTRGPDRWICFALLVLCCAFLRTLFQWLRAPFGLRFAILFGLAMSWIVLAAGWFDVRLIPQPLRFHLAMEIALVLVFGLILQMLFSKWPRLRWPAVLLLLVFCFIQYPHYRLYARHLIRRLEIKGTVEYQVAQWFDRNMQGERVAAPGTISFWMNVFTDTPQIIGCCDQSIVNFQNRIANYIIFGGYESDQQSADYSILWMKAYAVHAVPIGGPQSREHYKPVRYPYRFRNRLALLWQRDDDYIYRVPERAPGLARVVRANDLVKHPPENGIDVAGLRPFVAALDDPTLPILRTSWMGPNTARMDGVLDADQVVSVAMNFDKGWSATANRREVPVHKDGLGFIAIEPRCEGACAIELHWSAGWEPRIAWIFALAAISTLVFWCWRERSQLRA